VELTAVGELVAAARRHDIRENVEAKPAEHAVVERAFDEAHEARGSWQAVERRRFAGTEYGKDDPAWRRPLACAFDAGGRRADMSDRALERVMDDRAHRSFRPETAHDRDRRILQTDRTRERHHLPGVRV